MGTSSQHSGPKRSPLIPDDYLDFDSDSPDLPIPIPEETPSEEPRPDGDNESPHEISWSGAKTAMGRYTSGSWNGTIGKVASYYVKASGGARNARNASKSGIRTARNIVSFFGGISTSNARTILQDNNIRVEGRSSSDIFDDIINAIAPVGSTREESISRKAVVETFSELFSREEFDVDSLNQLNGDTLKTMLELFVGKYIYISIIEAMGYSILKNSGNNPARVNRIEGEMRDYIKAVVEIEFRDRTFNDAGMLSIEAINSLMKDLFQHCYQVLEDQL